MILSRKDIMRAAKEWLKVALTLLLLDLLWLGLFARGFYAAQLGALLRPETQRVAAALFYTFYVSVVWSSCVRDSRTWTQAGKKGAYLGFISYGVYELTNWAVIAGWPSALVPVDWAWGTFLTGVAAAAGRLRIRGGHL